MNYQKNILSKLLAIPLIALGTVSCEMNPMEEPLLSEKLDLASTEMEAEEGANLRVGGSILYEETFEGSNPFSTAHGLETGASHSVTYVARPGDSKNKTSRFELRDNDPDVKGSRRVEVTIVKGEDGDIEKDSWYAFELNVPADYIDEEDDEVINQWHQNGNASASIRIKNGRFLWRTYIDGKKVNTDLGAIQKNTWTSFVVHMVHSYGSDGVTEVWVNEKKIMDQTGRNINNDPLPKWKIGIYKSTWANEKTNTSSRVLYFDNVRVGDQTANYETMTTGLSSPSTPSPEPQPEPEEEITPEDAPIQEPISQPEPTVSQFDSGISALTFVNAQTDKDILGLNHGATVSIMKEGTHKISVRADVNSSSVASVKFELTGAINHTYIDNAAPFALFGDDASGNYYFGPGMSPGQYTLKITTYSGQKGSGNIIGNQVVNFKIDAGILAPESQPQPENEITPENPPIQEPVSQPEPSPQTKPTVSLSTSGISALTFLNAQTDKDILALTQGATVSIGTEGTYKISVRADINSSSVASVKFELTGAKNYSYIDNVAPFALFGDDASGNYYYGPGMSPGQYTLKITTYTGKKGSGNIIGNQVVNFTILR